LSGFNF